MSQRETSPKGQKCPKQKRPRKDKKCPKEKRPRKDKTETSPMGQKTLMFSKTYAKIRKKKYREET